MKILFLSRKVFPQIGGVERHVHKISKVLIRNNQTISIVSETNIKYPHKKVIGLLYIWVWLFKHRKLIIDSDIIHIHDVFIWYLPFRFIFFNKKVFIAIHGLEWGNPFDKWSIFQKRLAIKFSNGSIGVGKFLEKYIGDKFKCNIYGGLDFVKDKGKKTKNTITFVGRLEADTGLVQFLEWLHKNNSKGKYSINFVGDGSLRYECKKYGKVHGFCNPVAFYKKAETIVPSGYLTYLEAKSYGCKIITFYGNQLKKEYWEEIKNLKKFDTWEDVANKYLKLWRIK